MRRSILTLAAASAIGVAGVAAAPQQAHALAWWVVPAIVGGVVVGAGVGAAAANQADYSYAPGYAPAYGARGSVYVEPTAACYRERQVIHGRVRVVRVCD